MQERERMVIRQSLAGADDFGYFFMRFAKEAVDAGKRVNSTQIGMRVQWELNVRLQHYQGNPRASLVEDYARELLRMNPKWSEYITIGSRPPYMKSKADKKGVPKND